MLCVFIFGDVRLTQNSEIKSLTAPDKDGSNVPSCDQ